MVLCCLAPVLLHLLILLSADLSKRQLLVCLSLLHFVGFLCFVLIVVLLMGVGIWVCVNLIINAFLFVMVLCGLGNEPIWGLGAVDDALGGLSLGEMLVICGLFGGDWWDVVVLILLGVWCFHDELGLLGIIVAICFRRQLYLMTISHIHTTVGDVV